MALGRPVRRRIPKPKWRPNGAARIRRVVCAVDCGTVVNLDTVRAQIEGAIIFGITAELHPEITIVEQITDKDRFIRQPIPHRRQRFSNTRPRIGPAVSAGIQRRSRSMVNWASPRRTMVARRRAVLSGSGETLRARTGVTEQNSGQRRSYTNPAP